MVSTKHCICFSFVIMGYSLLGMGDPEAQVVVQVEPRRHSIASPEDIAKTAVRTTLGQPNEYLERMLTRRLKGEQESPKIIPIHRLPESESRGRLRQQLSTETQEAQHSTVEALSSMVDLTESTTLNQLLSKWVLNAVLDEKLKDREVRENSDYWKYINGTLAAILPIITFIVQYYLTPNNCASGSN
jgi:hypothetical protein